jgi:hypothetical protein
VVTFLQGIKDSKADAALASWVEDQYRDMKSQQLSTKLSWYMNMAMFYGNQWAEVQARYGKIQVPKAPPYRVRHVTNRVRPIIRTEYARVTSSKPSASVIPASSEDEDMFAAYAAEQVWESISSNKKLPEIWNITAWWMLLTGNGFTKTWWDQSIQNPDGTFGDICYGNVTPFHIFVPDLKEERIEDQPYVLNAYTRPVAWVEHFYGNAIGNVTPDVVNSQELLNDAYLDIKGYANKAKPDAVLIKEIWVKPGNTRQLMEGGMVTVVNGKVVTKGSMYSHGEYPFTQFKHIPSGKFYADSVISDLIPLQREYNRTRSQIMEAKNRMAKPQLVAAKGSIDPQKITNQPGLVILYRPGMPPPQPIPLSPLPSYVLQELDRNNLDMEDISGQHDVSKGGAPSGVTAATAISYLQEKDDSLLSHTYQSIENGMQKIAGQTLKLVVDYWDVERMVKVTGDDGFFDTLMLKGSDLKSGTDIRMEGGSALPTSKSARQAFLMDLMKMGFIDPADGLKLMDMGGVQKLWNNLKIDEAQGQRENIRLKTITADQIAQFQSSWQQAQQMGDQNAMQGQPDPMNPAMDAQHGMAMQVPSIIPVNTWDNHEVHIRVHNNYRKTQAFEMLQDEVKAQFEAHVNAHLAAVASAMQEAQGFQGMMGGAPDNSGGAPGSPGSEPPMPDNGFSPGGGMPPGQDSGGPPNAPMGGTING